MSQFHRQRLASGFFLEHEQQKSTPCRLVVRFIGCQIAVVHSVKNRTGPTRFTIAAVLFLAFVFQIPSSRAQMTDVLTYHNDNARTGQALHEEVLRPANVNTNHFGRLWVLPTDGLVDAQPLYAAVFRFRARECTTC